MHFSKVLKYPLVPCATLMLPVGFIARHVADQMGTTCLWAEVDTRSPSKPYFIAQVGTGVVLPQGAIYLGTVLESHGQYVWHYYAVPA